jgi:hypothetical protein
MKLQELEIKEDQFTAMLTRICEPQPTSLVRISESVSRRIRWRSSSHLSKSPDSSRPLVMSIEIHTSTVLHISPSLGKHQPITLWTQTMTITANKDQSIWCDICKVRWGTKHPLGQTAARWIVVSETIERKGVTRHYCQPCANEVQTRHDGSTWTFREQLDYALRAEQLHGI